MSSQSMDLSQVFGTAATQGIIGDQSLAVLSNLPNLGVQIQNSLGISPDEVDATEVFLVLFALDDSSSMHHNNNIQRARDGVKLTREALKASKSEDGILMSAVAFNRGVIFPFTTIDSVPELTDANYYASGQTPLYDQAVALCATILAKEEEFRQSGTAVRTASLFASDGANYNPGSRTTGRDVAPLIRDLRRRENHIVAAMGIDDGTTDFRAVFEEMGIDPKWILTPANDPQSIRRAFEVFSKTSATASQGAAGFSQALGRGL